MIVTVTRGTCEKYSMGEWNHPAAGKRKHCILFSWCTLWLQCNLVTRHKVRRSRGSGLICVGHTFTSQNVNRNFAHSHLTQSKYDIYLWWSFIYEKHASPLKPTLSFSSPNAFQLHIASHFTLYFLYVMGSKLSFPGSCSLPSDDVTPRSSSSSCYAEAFSHLGYVTSISLEAAEGDFISFSPRGEWGQVACRP